MKLGDPLKARRAFVPLSMLHTASERLGLPIGALLMMTRGQALPSGPTAPACRQRDFTALRSRVVLMRLIETAG
jgi:hypothetical protein